MANKLLKTLNFGGNDKYDLSPDWENVRNRPFGYETPTGGDTLTWDGNTNGLEGVMGILYRVHEATPTAKEGTVEINANGTVTSTPFTVEDKNDGVQFLIANNVAMVVIVPTDGITVDGLNFTKKGIYFRYTGEMYVSSLTVKDYEGFAGIQPISGAYLPKALRFGESEDGGIVEILPPTECVGEGDEFYLFNVIEGIEDGQKYVVNYNGVDYESEAMLFSDEDMSAYLLGNYALMMGIGDTGEPFLLMALTPESARLMGVGGMVMPIDGATSITISISGEGSASIEPINIKYLPKQLQIGEETRSKNITWDGKPTRVYGGDNYLYYKVAGYVPTLEELNGKTITVMYGGQIMPFVIDTTSSDIDIKDDYISLTFGFVLIAKKDGTIIDSGISRGTYPEKGIYFAVTDTARVTSIDLGEGTYTEVIGLDTKYLQSCALKSEINNKVDKESGKGLSEYNFSHGYKTKLDRVTGYLTYGRKYENVTTGYDVETEERIITDTMTAESGAEVFNDEANNRAIGSRSHAEGYATRSVGSSSHAEGRETNAVGGFGSHAEGYQTLASGESSHAEGNGTIANGYGSHAEGIFTKAYGGYSHAEGGSTKTTADYAHAEGYSTIASGWGSHAEGNNTVASAYRSHAEGYYTIASGHAQHVQGQYNIEDTEGKYAHIVGNGKNSNNSVTRSNAHTLDWQGNAWYSGSVECTEVILKSATNGSTKRFRIKVYDDGSLKAFEITS
jgi:hypothetical protein